MAPALDHLRRALVMKRVGYAIGAAIMLLAGLAVWLPFQVEAIRRWLNLAPPPPGAGWIITALAFGLFGAALVFGVLCVRTPPALRHPLWQLLTRFPEDVVWIHDDMVVETRVEGIRVGRTRYVFFLTVEPRRNQSIELKESIAREVMAAAPTLCPRAIIGGHSPARMARYLADPRGFRDAERTVAGG